MTTQQIPKLKGQVRDRLGTQHSTRMRKEGRLPAVIYGHKQDPLHVWFDQKEATDLLHRHAHVLEVVMDAKNEPCLVKDVQWNHLGSQIIHIDLARVDLTERVTVEIELEFVGEPVGLKEAGAFLQRPMSEIKIECLASQIPEKIKVDISGLEADKFITVGDLALPSGVTAEEDPETVVASIQIVQEEVVAVAAPTGEASTEPEVIGKKAKEEEGEAAPAEAKPKEKKEK